MEFGKILLMLFVVCAITSVWCNDLCKCNHCDDDRSSIGMQENGTVEDIVENTTSIEENPMLKEDFDGDGSDTICARERDHEDRSFPSICHMYCYNACTEFNARVNSEQNGTYDVMAYRTNYYKLHDGPCPRRYREDINVVV